MDSESLTADGWRMTQGDGFTNLAGPFWLRDDGENFEVGMLIEPRHCNEHLGTLHGGVTMTFADIALGAVGARVMGGENSVTTQLNTHFISTARVGEFLHCRPELVRLTSRLYFTRALIVVGERVVASCDGVWTIIDPKAVKSENNKIRE
jgi:uncharacterized protein (TIGR00369 family)